MSATRKIAVVTVTNRGTSFETRTKGAQVRPSLQNKKPTLVSKDPKTGRQMVTSKIASSINQLSSLLFKHKSA